MTSKSHPVRFLREELHAQFELLSSVFWHSLTLYSYGYYYVLEKTKYKSYRKKMVEVIWILEGFQLIDDHETSLNDRRQTNMMYRGS